VRHAAAAAAAAAPAENTRGQVSPKKSGVRNRFYYIAMKLAYENVIMQFSVHLIVIAGEQIAGTRRLRKNVNNAYLPNAAKMM